MPAFGLRLVLLAGFAAPLAVEAETLKVVEVNAPAVNCVFQASCRITVTDSVGHIPLPFIATAGAARLQSRRFTAGPRPPRARQNRHLFPLHPTPTPRPAGGLRGGVLPLCPRGGVPPPPP